MRAYKVPLGGATWCVVGSSDTAGGARGRAQHSWVVNGTVAAIRGHPGNSHGL